MTILQTSCKNQCRFVDQCNQGFNLKSFYKIPLTWWKTYFCNFSNIVINQLSHSCHAVFRDTLGFLFKISFTQLLYHPWGCFGCPEKCTSSRNYNLFSGSAVFQPKCNKIENTYKNHHNPLKVTIFSNFGWKTVAQILWIILLLLTHIQRGNNSGDIMGLGFFGGISDLWRNLFFSILSKYSPISPWLVLALKNKYLKQFSVKIATFSKCHMR